MFKKNKSMLKKDEQWFGAIKWDVTCLECQRENGGVCERRHCAEFKYDEWGDPIPDWLYFDDGNNVAEYLEEKRKRMEALSFDVARIDAPFTQ